MRLLIVYIAAIGLSRAADLNISEAKLYARGRISEGLKAVDGQFPYMVGINFYLAKGGFRNCGGSSIGHEWILTTAHCLKESKLAYVYLGATDKRILEVSHNVLSKNFIIHPDYNSQIFEHDIALLKIPFTKYTMKIKPIRLPSLANIDTTYKGEIAEMPGWGVTGDNNIEPDRLQWAEFKVIENSVCAQSYKRQISDSNICIAIEGGICPRSGDSGSPLALKSTNTQIAIVSFFSRLGLQKGKPVVLTRLTSHLEWIKQHTGISY